MTSLVVLGLSMTSLVETVLSWLGRDNSLESLDNKLDDHDLGRDALSRVWTKSTMVTTLAETSLSRVLTINSSSSDLSLAKTTSLPQPTLVQQRIAPTEDSV